MSEQISVGVYRALLKIQAALSQAGIGKGRKNQQQGFMYRSVDDVYNALAPLASEHGLVIIPQITECETVSTKTKNGAPMTVAKVKGCFTFLYVEDGSQFVVTTFGEAMDMADKAIGKAMSYAHKSALLMTFIVPTEGDNDPDRNSFEPSGDATVDAPNNLMPQETKPLATEPKVEDATVVSESPAPTPASPTPAAPAPNPAPGAGSDEPITAGMQKVISSKAGEHLDAVLKKVGCESLDAVTKADFNACMDAIKELAA